MPPVDVRATWHGSKVVLVPASMLGSIFLESDRLVGCRGDFAFLRGPAAEPRVTIGGGSADDLDRLPFHRSQP